MIAPVAIRDQVDVVVIGGGPAGATAATLIAQAGHTVELFERDHFPRFHIGESLIPETYHTFKRLQVLDKLRNSAFTKKHSVQFVAEGGKNSAPFYFADNNPHESSQTWQVLRSEFDVMMLNNAREFGVRAHEGIRVREAMFEGDRAVGVSIALPDKTTKQVHAKVVIDASGQTCLLQNRLKLKEIDPELNKGAVWTYFKNAKRDPGRDEGATLVMQVEGKKSWFWFIPLHDDITSIGVVGPFKEIFDGRDHAAIFNDQLQKCPGCVARLQDATRVNEYYATKDYSYRATQTSGDGWVLVGDAYAFLDPLYSSGVLLALKSGECAADAIVSAFRENDFSADSLGRWKPEFDKGMQRMRRLVCEYYDGFSFGAFTKKNPHLKGRITDLLVGDLFESKYDELFDAIDQFKAEQAAMRATVHA